MVAVVVVVAVGWYQNRPTDVQAILVHRWIDGWKQGGGISGGNNKSAASAAAGTSVDEDPDEEVARTTTGCVSNATTSGGDEEVNKKKNTVEGAFIVVVAADAWYRKVPTIQAVRVLVLLSNQSNACETDRNFVLRLDFYRGRACGDGCMVPERFH